MALESEAFLLGMWKNFDELESSISLEELNAILEAKHNREFEQQRFAAALKGVQLDNPRDTKFEEVRKRAEAKARGISEEQLAFGEIGISIESEDELE